MLPFYLEDRTILTAKLDNETIVYKIKYVVLTNIKSNLKLNRIWVKRISWFIQNYKSVAKNW